MNPSSGVTPPHQPQSSGVPQSGPTGSGEVTNPLQTPVATMDDLKKLLFSTLGDQKGGELYDLFMKSMIMMAMSTMQQAADHAKRGAHQMGHPT